MPGAAAANGTTGEAFDSKGMRVGQADLRWVEASDLHCDRCERTKAGEATGNQGTKHRDAPGCARSGRARDGRPLRGAEGAAGLAAAAARK